jgi:trk system potassium uptake protein TrkA
VHIVIMGCGRVGAELAHRLDDSGHSVAVVDQDRNAFRRLGTHFGGRTITGVGFDRDALVEAGIEEAKAFAAVSSGDNSNIISARVARETFAVEHVVARIYDPKRAEVYQRLGIPTVATVRWTTEQMLRRLLPEGATVEWSDASGTVRLAEVHTHPAWIGRALREVEKVSPVRVAFVSRFGEGVLPTDETVLQEGDLLHLIVRDRDVGRVESILGAAPGGGVR